MAIKVNVENENETQLKKAASPKANAGTDVSDADSQIVFDVHCGANVKTNLKEVLVREPVTLEVNEFTEESARAFEAGVARALRTAQPVLVVTIDSYGGAVYALFRMLDALRAARDRGVTIVTVAKSKAMSCGAILFAAGSRRYVGEDAIVLVHDVAGFNWGKLPDIVADAKHTEYLGFRLYNLLDTACGQEAGYWAARVHDNGHADVYLTAGDARDCNLATHVGTPKLGIAVVANYYLDDKPVRVSS